MLVRRHLLDSFLKPGVSAGTSFPTDALVRRRIP